MIVIIMVILVLEIVETVHNFDDVKNPESIIFVFKFTKQRQFTAREIEFPGEQF